MVQISKIFALILCGFITTTLSEERIGRFRYTPYGTFLPSGYGQGYAANFLGHITHFKVVSQRCYHDIRHDNDQSDNNQLDNNQSDNSQLDNSHFDHNQHPNNQLQYDQGIIDLDLNSVDNLQTHTEKKGLVFLEDVEGEHITYLIVCEGERICRRTFFGAIYCGDPDRSL